MTGLYLQPGAINTLTQLIILLVMLFYLLSIRGKLTSTWLLIGFLLGYTSFVFLNLLFSIFIYEAWLFSLVKFYLTSFLVGMVFLLQFAYHFPRPHRRREAQLVLLLSIPAALSALNFNIKHQDIIQISLFFIEYLWIVIVLLRQTIWLSRQEREKQSDSNVKVKKKTTLLQIWFDLYRPQGKEAKAARAFVLTFLIPLWVTACYPLSAIGGLSGSMAELIINIGVTLIPFTTVLVYLNHMPQRSSFRVKLVGVSLVTMLIILSVLGEVLKPLYMAVASSQPESQFSNQQTTFRFKPNQAGAYDISAIDFRFEHDYGVELGLLEDDSKALPLHFGFPFYGHVWNELYVKDDGLVSFGRELSLADFGRGQQAAIAIFFRDLSAADGGQIFSRSESDKITITWKEMPNWISWQKNTFQLVLYDTGIFDMSYENIESNWMIRGFDPRMPVPPVGIFSGKGTLPSEAIHFATDLPFSNRQPYGLVDNSYRHYRQALHEHTLPLFYLIVGSTLFILIAFPLFLQSRLVMPLNRLLLGVKEVNQGNLEVWLPSQYNDEIGFLTHSFNRMVQSLQEANQIKDELNGVLQESNQKLELRVDQRTAELLQAKQKAETAQQKAERANQAKSIFLANMSHELRTPLNAILGFSQLMGRSHTVPAEHQAHLGIIGRSGEHLLTLINNVLDLSKIEAGRTTLNNTDFDLHSLLDDLQQMFWLRAKEKQLQLEFERSLDVPQYIEADEVKLRQVLINLLNNALKFTKEGRVLLRITKGGAGEANQVVPSLDDATAERTILAFEVQDSGVGIAADELDTLFEAFVQSESGRQAQEGTGLGLPISRQFVQLMGGEMRVSSLMGYGTTFSFDICVRMVADSLKKQVPTRQAIALMPNQPTYRILIVDDHQNNRQLLVELLTPLGFALQEASNGQEALERWQEWKPHLIWMDMRMPVIDGYEATKRIKQTSEGEKTPIIALTASAFEEERAIVLQAGCDDFMRKPFKQAQILQMMSQYLGVQYLYEEDKPPATEESSRPLAIGDNQSSFDAQWLTKIEEAALILDQDQMLSLIEQIRDTAPARATELERWVDDFEYEHMFEFIEQQKAAGGRRQVV